MQLVQKLKQFEKQIVFLKWGCSEEYGRINYVGYDFIEFEVLDTDTMEYTDKVIINAQLILEIVVKGSDISRIIAEYSSTLPSPMTDL
jgi:hypothetical protein